MHALDKQEIRGGMLATIFSGMIGALLGRFSARILLGITRLGISLFPTDVSLGEGLVISFFYRIFARGVADLTGSKGGESNVCP